MIADAVVTDADARAAQDLVDTWVHLRVVDTHPGHTSVDPGDLLELRGLLTARMADVRAAGYLEGLQEGRREAGSLILQALRDEGLAP